MAFTLFGWTGWPKDRQCDTYKGKVEKGAKEGLFGLETVFRFA
jgi:hypothetical protein